MIRFDNITKSYPGVSQPAVQNLSITVPEGETCVVIGPSGCGKTTTMKMVNRLIEPTSGEIYVGDRNVLKQNPAELRRGIGYVIQQIGLFPHFTILENIGTVPKMLGWDKSRISKRADELLEIVGLEPSRYRDAYPRQLSGGQRQRVGVARALAADPPVMLMDEPFGAIDPITRDRLQNEFLRLQKQMRKTIMFVTHDIDEAIKMGTLVCILEVGGVLQQLDTPTNILSSPANSFVADFVGSDRGLKKLTIVRVGEVMDTDVVVGRYDETAGELERRMRARDLDSLFIVDDKSRVIGYVTLERSQAQRDRRASEIIQKAISTIEEEATMKDAFSEMLSHGISYLPVVGQDEKLIGMVTAEDAQRLVKQTKEPVQV